MDSCLAWSRRSIRRARASGFQAARNFLFQMHYVTTGRPHTDVTKMAFYLHDEPPAERLMTTAASAGDFVIPPGKKEHRVKR